MPRDMLLTGGVVRTMDDAGTLARAVAVRDGIIAAVGGEDECRTVLSADHERIDLAGAALLPGFIDTHLHPTMMIYYDMNVNLRGARSIQDVERRLRDAAEKKAPAEWVVGLDFNEQDFFEPRMISRHDLDQICPDHPTVLIRHDGHSVIANTRAIDVADVGAGTPDPPGGRIDRERDGRPAGAFRESASQIILSRVPLPDMESFAAAAKGTFRRLAAHGITSVGAVIQAGEEGPLGASGAFDGALLSFLLEYSTVNMYGMVIAKDPSEIDALLASPLHNPDEPGGNRIGAVKIFADGSFGSLTSFMSEPFSDAPDRSGFLVHETDELYRRMVFAHKAGLQIAVHSIGDAANRTCIDLFARLLAEHPREDHRHRIEHASILDAAMIDDMALLGLVAAVQPLFIQSEKHWLERRLGPARARITYPFRSMLDGGVGMAGASDAPVESVDVLHALQCCVTREGFEPEESITAEKALSMFTIGAAFAQHEESNKGSIVPGKRADLVVLSADPTSVHPDNIRSIRVLRTLRAGETTFET